MHGGTLPSVDGAPAADTDDKSSGADNAASDKPKEAEDNEKESE